MKILLIIGLVILYNNVDGQKIKVDEIDKFTKVHRVETNFVNLKQAFGCMMRAKLRSVDTLLLLELNNGNCGVGVVGKDDYALFLLDNDSTIKVYSKGIQSYDISTGSMGGGKYSYQEFLITKEQLLQFKDRRVKSVRRTFNENYKDIDIPGGMQENLPQLAALFVSKL